MSFFSRNQQSQETIGLEQQGQFAGDVCTPEYCQAESAALRDIDPYKAELLEKLHTEAEAWDSELSTARTIAEDVQAKIKEVVDSNDRMFGLNHAERRNGQRGIDRNITNDMVGFRTVALNDISKHSAGYDFDTSFLGGPSLSEEVALKTLRTIYKRQYISTHLETVSNKNAVGVVNVSGHSVRNPYHRPFAQELFARHSLAQFIRQAPDIAASLLTPAAVVNLPLSTQRLIAADIASGPKSIVLNFVKNQAVLSADLFGLTNENNLSPAVKEYVKAIQLGAKAIGGCDCPLNDIGICRSVSDNIPVEALPPEVQKALKTRDQTATDTLVRQLQSFANQRPISKWWLSTAKLATPEAIQSSTKSSRKRVGSTAVQQATISSFEQSLEQTQSLAEVVGTEKVRLSVKGGDKVYDIDLSDEAAVEAALDMLLTTGHFTDYINRYRHQKNMPELLRASAKLILTTPNYFDAPAISHMQHFDPIRSVIDGKRNLVVWHLVGTKMPKIAGKEGNDMRIYFGMNNEGSTRRLEITRVCNKGDIVKGYRRGNRLS